MRLCFDTEGNGLVSAWDSKRKKYHPEITKFWVISLRDLDTGDNYTFHHGQGDKWWVPALELMSNAKELICHNQIDFDLPALDRVLGWSPSSNTTIIDTLVLSRLFDPDRLPPEHCTGGPHSVEAWGLRLGVWKPEQEQWLKFEPSMINRCQKDVDIQCKMYEALLQEKGRHPWGKAIEVEHESARIMTQQRLNGVHIDQEHANECVTDLEERIARVTKSLIKYAPRRASRYGVEVLEPFTKQGRHKKLVSDWFDRGDVGVDTDLDVRCVNGPFTRVQFDSINLNSHPQLHHWLFSLGWQPTEWNYKKVTENESKDPDSPWYGQRPKSFALDAEGNRVRSSPKITEESFDTIPGVIGEEIKERFRYTKRLGLFTGVLAALREDGRVPALVNPLGTNTNRMKHQLVANIPKALTDKETKQLLVDLPVTDSCFYGVQCRQMFACREGWKLVGHDASGIELRMLAHYINDAEFTELIVNGDVHTRNQLEAGLPNRDMAKTMIYAINYGAGDETLAAQLGVTPEEAGLLKKKFLDANPLITNLIKHVKKACRKGYLKGLDGRKIWMRQFDGRIQEHKALNTLLQSAGAIVMTYSRVLLDQWVREENLRVVKVIDYHDEAQAEVHPDDVQRYRELAELSIVKAGEMLKCNVPLAAESKVGRTWADTH